MELLLRRVCRKLWVHRWRLVWVLAGFHLPLAWGTQSKLKLDKMSSVSTLWVAQRRLQLLVRLTREKQVRVSGSGWSQRKTIRSSADTYWASVRQAKAGTRNPNALFTPALMANVIPARKTGCFEWLKQAYKRRTLQREKNLIEQILIDLSI